MVARRPTSSDPGVIGRSASSTTIVVSRRPKCSDLVARPRGASSASACTGASDEPTASMTVSTVGSSDSSPSFTSADSMLPPEPRSRSEEVS